MVVYYLIIEGYLLPRNRGCVDVIARLPSGEIQHWLELAGGAVIGKEFNSLPSRYGGLEVVFNEE